MTDNEIIKALDVCSKSTNGCSHSKYTCEDCYLNGQPMCYSVLLQDALDLINRLQADKEALIAGQETLQKALAEKIAEVERLTNLCQEQNTEIKRQIEIKNRLLYNLKAVCEEMVGDTE